MIRMKQQLIEKKISFLAMDGGKSSSWSRSFKRKLRAELE
jgi:hypothetical protein